MIFPINKDRIIQKNKTPNHGLKNGTKAIELSKVAIIRLKLLKLNISKRIKDRIKCSITINSVA
jgi:hypothetical protein